jgi:hypothetical protein
VEAEAVHLDDESLTPPQKVDLARTNPCVDLRFG